MLNANFKVERSNFEPCLRTSIHKYSLFNFLKEHDMLKEKYKVLTELILNTYQPLLSVPAKLASKMPFILAATKCEQLEKCICNNNLKLVKSRLKNYYCEDFFKKLVSVFGNEKAWNEFGITSMWKPKLSFVKIERFRPEPSVPYLKFMTYKECTHRRPTFRIKYVITRLLIGIRWDNSDVSIKHLDSLWKVNNISKIKISRTLNNPDESIVNHLMSAADILEDNKQVLTKDGARLLKDLSLFRTLL